MAVFAVTLTASACALRSTSITSDAGGNWAAVVALTEGTTVEIETVDGSVFAGRVAAADAEALTIADKGARMTLARLRIRQVAHVRRRTTEYAKRGLAIGAVAGGVVSLVTTVGPHAAFTAFMAATWGAIGAGIGASDGAFSRQDVVVYIAGPATRVP
jgi:hypothetical protein